jgi:hypothetical protein
VISTRVIARGQGEAAGSVEVTVAADAGGASAIVTGRVPEVGSTVNEGAVLIEVGGRPVLALGGDLPAYRALAAGQSGPDVSQLEESLVRMGRDPGTRDGVYDAALGNAVATFYRDSGYSPPSLPEGVQASIDGARSGVDSARSQVNAARQALNQAGAGPTQQQLTEAQGAVNVAQVKLDAANGGGDAIEIAEAQAELANAQAALAALQLPRSTSAEQAALREANTALSKANTELNEALAKNATPFPLAELVFIPGLPQRVDSVFFQRGEKINGPVLVVSGAQLQVVATVTAAEREFLSEGTTVRIDGGGLDGEVTGIITSFKEKSGSDNGGGGGSGERSFDIYVTPQNITAGQEALLRNANVRLQIDVKSTDGDVLAVPLAALSANAGGESSVEVENDDGSTRIVKVEVGLSAEGFAEVTPVEGELSEGDRVVVGKD